MERGRPKTISEQIRREICLIAPVLPPRPGTPVRHLEPGQAGGHVTAIGLVPSISRETVRRILRERGVSWQATKTWKASTDPDFVPKMRRVLELYDHPPSDGRVICADEFGPLNLQPRPGRAWRPVGQPGRLRATYHRYDGVRHMLAALDLATGKMIYRIRQRKRWMEFLAFLKVPALAQRSRRTQNHLRPRLGHPHLDRLQDQRCMTRH